jgi:arginine N-succinyltransferase
MRKVRAVAEGDFEALVALAESIDGNMTTMPRDRAGTSARLQRALASFEPDRELRGDELYMFVLEDDDGEIIGTSAVYSNVGHDRPFYSYKISKITKSSPELEMRLDTEILSPVNDYTGVTEVGGLYLRADRRGEGRGSLISLSRLLFIATHRHRFEDRVLAEMRGFTNDEGRSPFWDAVGRKFFQLELSDADVRSAREYRFVADLLPRYPLYVDLLPADARNVIGVPHPGAEPAAALLKREGFRFHGYVDIFDAGPTLDAHIDDLYAVRSSVTAPIDTRSVVPEEAPFVLVCAGSLGSFRAIGASGLISEDRIVVDEAAAVALNVTTGEPVTAYRPPASSSATSAPIR